MMAVSVDESSQEISLGTPRTLFPLGTPTRFFSFDVSPDGQRFLITTTNPLAGPTPLTLVTNWDVELKKR
jgi:hypothetical protein